MFSKQTKGDGASAQPSKPSGALSAALADAARKGPRVASLITDEMKIEGNLSGDGELHIDGLVRGDVKIARLTVGESGRIEGTVTADAVDCRGRIVGSITAKEVRLYASAHVDGDIVHDELAIESGAFFQGRCLKIQPQAQPLPVPANPTKLAAPVAKSELHPA